MKKTMEDRVSELEILVAKLIEENNDMELTGAELVMSERLKNRSNKEDV